MPRKHAASSLEAFLTAPGRPAGTFTYHELQGFLFSVATAPELIKPSEWIPEIISSAIRSSAEERAVSSATHVVRKRQSALTVTA